MDAANGARAVVRLREAVPDDAVALSALGVQVFLDTYATDGVRPDLAREAFASCAEAGFRARIADAARRFVLAARGDALLGFADVALRPEGGAPVPGLAGAELARLYLQPRAQGQGVGARLLHAAERLATRDGAPTLWLTAWEGNHRALTFYAREGYADVGATSHTFEGRSYGNRVLRRALHPDADVRIAIEPPAQPDVVDLIEALDAYQVPLYRPESHHGIDLAALGAPSVVFAVARTAQGEAVACGAVVIEGDTAELKRMFTRPGQRGRGIGGRLLAFLEARARARGCRVVALETGVLQAEALRLYAARGYVRCGPFGPYTDDPSSVFLRKSLDAVPAQAEWLR